MSPFRLPRLALDPRLATLLLALAATLLPVALVAAATSPLGFTLGQTTFVEVGRSVPADKIKGIHRDPETGGPRIAINPTVFDFDGLEEVVLVFDADQHLAMALLTIAKRRFGDVLADLRAKYSIDRESIDNFMQNGVAIFRGGDDWILFNAPHLSFSIGLNYVTNEVWHKTLRSIEEDEAKKRQQERGKL